MITRQNSVVAVLVVVLLAPAFSQAASWYVSKTGSDSNPGTQALPKLTINAAIDLMAGGDTVLIGSGTYDELLTNVSTGSVVAYSNPIPNGTSSLKTTIKADTGANVLLRPVTNTYPGGGGAVTLVSTAQYIDFDGINIDAVQNHTQGILIEGAFNTYRNAEVTGAKGNGVASFGGDSITFSNLRVHDNGGGFEPGHGHGCYVCGTNKVIENSEVYDNANYGIQVSCESGGIQNAIVRGNYVHDNPSRGIQVQGSNALITNNLVVNNGIGIGTANPGAKIFNNTIHGWTNTVSDSYGILVGASSTEVKNNIITAQDDNVFSGGKSRYIYWLSGTPTFGGNVCDVTRTGCGIVDSIKDIMVNAAGGDLHLADGSPAIGYGVATTPSVTTDFDGILRVTNDSGAYAFLTGVAGDYNDDGVVDAADYVVWRNGGPLQHEGTSLGVVDGADYDFWRANFGKTAAGSANASLAAAAIPEPTTLVLLAIALPALVHFATSRFSYRCRCPR